MSSLAGCVTSLPDGQRLALTRSSRDREDTFPRFWRISLPAGRCRYDSTTRTLANLPPIRRDLIKRRLYLVPNSIVVTRLSPSLLVLLQRCVLHRGRTFYTQTVDAALREIAPSFRHLYFLDDHLLGNPLRTRPFPQLIAAWGTCVSGRSNGRSILRDDVIVEAAIRPGCAACSSDLKRYPRAVWPAHKRQNLGRSYAAVVKAGRFRNHDQ